MLYNVELGARSYSQVEPKWTSLFSLLGFILCLLNSIMTPSPQFPPPVSHSLGKPPLQQHLLSAILLISLILDVAVFVSFHVSCHQFSSVQFSHSVMSDSLQPHVPQHARPPCPSLTRGIHPNPYPLSWWCHPTISSSVISFLSCLNPSQHQGLFKWVSSSHQVAKVLEFRPQYQSFQWTSRTGLL